MISRTVVLPWVLAACVTGTIGCRAAPPADDVNDLAVATYGAAPAPSTSVQLQPDVVIVKGGARAIRSASRDGLTWTIDGSAAGAANLAIGRVMFMTSRAVGRVIRIDRRGPDIVVTLAPVRLTEVIKNADIRIDQELAPDSAVYQEGTQGPGTVTELAAIDVPRFVAARWQAPAPVANDSMTEARKGSIKVKVGRFEVEPYLKMTDKGNTRVTQVGVKVAAGTSMGFELGKGTSGKSGMKFGADVSLYGTKLTVHAKMPIINGAMGSGTTLLIDGIDRMEVGLLGGVENGASDNIKVRFEVPVEITVPLPPASGIPFALHFKWKVLLDLGFSGRNSSITAHGLYGLAGPIGLQDGKVVAPKLDVVEPMMQSIGGIAVGNSGIVVALEFRALVGLGTADWQAGPYGKLITSVGISRGSAVAMVNCTGLTLKVDIGNGMGLQISAPVQDFLKRLLGIDAKKKLEIENFETMLTIFHKTAYQPDSAKCRAAG